MSKPSKSFIRGLPKAELHIHIEGSLEPEQLFELAKRNGVALPFPDVEACRAAYSFTDLQSFLDIYYQGAAVLQTEIDFYELMEAYLRRAHDDGVRRAEIFFDPQTHTDRGITFDVFMGGFSRAIRDVEIELGISADLIMCFLRHLSGSDAVATFEQARDHLHQFIGVGLDSSEVDQPPEQFVEAFELAHRAGLHLVAHAGEEGPPDYIIGALDALGVQRIDHGVRSEEMPELVRRLAADTVPLTVCPLSNLELGVVSDLNEHNLKRLMDQGILVTINSDDPAYFGGYIADNYIAIVDALELDRNDVIRLARNSFNAAFVTTERRDIWLAEIDDFVDQHEQGDQL